MSVDISRFIPPPAPIAKDPIALSVERFVNMMDLKKSNDFTNELNPVDDLSRTNVEKELKTSGVTKNLELQQTLPNASEKTRAKLRKVNTPIITKH